MVEKYGYRGPTLSVIIIIFSLFHILYIAISLRRRRTSFFPYFLVFTTVAIMWGLLLGGLPLVWCSSVHHAALSRRRPGFKSRHEHQKLPFSLFFNINAGEKSLNNVGKGRSCTTLFNSILLILRKPVRLPKFP